MAYNADKLIEQAIKLLQDDSKIITYQELYGMIGVSYQYWYNAIATHKKYDEVEALLMHNKTLRAKKCIDNYRYIADSDKAYESSRIQATDRLAKIVSKEIREAISDRVDRIFENADIQKPENIEDIKKEIQKLVAENGFHDDKDHK